MAKRVYEYIFIFCFGALGYSLIELLFRGYTHWTMTLTGGLVFLLLYFLNTRIINGTLFKRCVIGSIAITGVEFVVGYYVNIIFKMNVWDYSERAFHIMGQICPLFTFLWFLLCIPIIPFCLWLKKSYFNFDGKTDNLTLK
ncbi:MAG: hypothetical protein RR911_01315 [Oscillospiraceae bacterium]